MKPRRIWRVPILHLTAFESILAGVHRAGCSVRSHGYEWRLVSDEEGVQIYERADYGLAWLRASVEDYERIVYRLLACGTVGADGFLRPRTDKVIRDLSGAYRRRIVG
jgi:hypothetical protein